MDPREEFLARWAQILRRKWSGQGRFFDDPQEALDVLAANARATIASAGDALSAMPADHARRRELQSLLDEMQTRYDALATTTQAGQDAAAETLSHLRTLLAELNG